MSDSAVDILLTSEHVPRLIHKPHCHNLGLFACQELATAGKLIKSWFKMVKEDHMSCQGRHKKGQDKDSQKQSAEA